jgi:hypothetical protein
LHGTNVRFEGREVKGEVGGEIPGAEFPTATETSNFKHQISKKGEALRLNLERTREKIQQEASNVERSTSNFQPSNLERGTESGVGCYIIFRPTKRPRINRTTQITRNRKNRNLAMSAAAPAIPVNPSNAAMMAITRKIAAHFSIKPPWKL